MKQPIVLVSIRETDYPKLIKLWEVAGNIEVRQTDTPEVLARFLYRNPTCSYAAYAGTRLIGAILAGHDGWRGYLYHMAVKPDYLFKSMNNTKLEAKENQRINKVQYFA